MFGSLKHAIMRKACGCVQRKHVHEEVCHMHTNDDNPSDKTLFRCPITCGSNRCRCDCFCCLWRYCKHNFDGLLHLGKQNNSTQHQYRISQTDICRAHMKIQYKHAGQDTMDKNDRRKGCTRCLWCGLKQNERAGLFVCVQREHVHEEVSHHA